MLTADRPPAPDAAAHVPPVHGGNAYTRGPPPAVPRPGDIMACEPGGTFVYDPNKLYLGATHEQAARMAGKNTAMSPKVAVGNTKVPMLSVIPATALVRMARALQYGAFFAPRKDAEPRGYGPHNWTYDRITYMKYIDASMRHLACAADREDLDPDTGAMFVGHLEEAMASIAILIDAIEHGTCDDDRPPKARGLVAKMLREMREKI